MTATHQTTLGDGSIVVIRPIEDSDAELLGEAFTRLSATTRQLRFHNSKKHLSSAELTYLTQVDHHDHEAVIALDPQDGRVLGVARYIRSHTHLTRAEMAITVVDDWQSKGLGGELLTRLAQRAREQGVCQFTALVSFGNTAISRLLRQWGATICVSEHDEFATEYLIDLPSEGLGAELRNLLRAVAIALTTPAGDP